MHKKILVVNDDAAIGDLLHEMLENAEYAHAQAETADPLGEYCSRPYLD